MWYAMTPMETTADIQQFEEAFRFSFPSRFREFLALHNGAKATDILFLTPMGERPLTEMLDFRAGNTRCTADSAWEVNRRLRSTLGVRRVAFAKSNRHLICMERVQRNRTIVVWNYITQTFEPITVPLEDFIGLCA